MVIGFIILGILLVGSSTLILLHTQHLPRLPDSRKHKSTHRDQPDTPLCDD